VVVGQDVPFMEGDSIVTRWQAESRATWEVNNLVNRVSSATGLLRHKPILREQVACHLGVDQEPHRLAWTAGIQ